MAESVELDDPLEAILDMDKIREDFPPLDESDAAKPIGQTQSDEPTPAASSMVLDRPLTSSTLEDSQSLTVTGHGTHIHGSNSDRNIFPSPSPESGAVASRRSSRLSSKSTSNTGALSPKAVPRERRPRYKPYDRPDTMHSPITSEQEPAIFKCSYTGCEHETEREDNLKKHINAVHLKVIKWRCPICGKGCTQSHNGPEHIARGHHIEHECPICHKQLDWKQMVQHFEDPSSTCIQPISHLCSQAPENQRHLFTMPAGN